MNQNPESFQNQPLSDAEKRRLESEIAKNEAESRKLIAEAEEVEKRVRKKWFVNELFVKWVLGGVVAACLVAAWGITYFYPIFNKKQELAKLENMRLAEENARKTQITEQLRLDIEGINRKSSEIQVGYKTLSNSYDSLVNKANFTAQERAKLQEQNNAQKRELEQLHRDQMEVDRRLRTFPSQQEPQFKTIYFDSTSFELRPEAKASLDENARTLQEFPDIKIRIEAYGDGVLWNTTMEHRQHPGVTYQTFFDRDLALGEKRARKAMDYLTGQGISASRITIVGHPGEPQSTRRSCRFVVVNQ